MHFVSDLYGVNVRPVAPFGSASRRPYADPALIHRSLPDELLFEVFHVTNLWFFIIDLMVVLDGGSTLCESSNRSSYYLLYAAASDQLCVV